SLDHLLVCVLQNREPHEARAPRVHETCYSRESVGSLSKLMRVPSHNLTRTLNSAAFLTTMAFVLWNNGSGVPRFQSTPEGILELTILDAGSGEPTPARVEVLDSEGKGYVAEDALPIADQPVKLERPWQGTVEDALKSMTREFRHAYARS